MRKVYSSYVARETSIHKGELRVRGNNLSAHAVRRRYMPHTPIDPPVRATATHELRDHNLLPPSGGALLLFFVVVEAVPKLTQDGSTQAEHRGGR